MVSMVEEGINCLCCSKHNEAAIPVVFKSDSDETVTGAVCDDDDANTVELLLLLIVVEVTSLRDTVIGKSLWISISCSPALTDGPRVRSELSLS